MAKEDPRIAVGISTYSNPKGLDDTLASISPRVDQVFVVHGCYLGFCLQDPHSLSLTKEVTSKYPNISLFDMTASQIDKRNKYLEEAKDYDFLLVCDDDEVIKLWNTSDTKLGVQQTLQRIINKQQNTPNIYGVCLHQKRDDCIPVELPRLFYLPGRWRYTGNHYNFLVDGKFRGSSARDSIHWSTIVMKHNDWQKAQRTKEFEKGMERYEIWQTSGGEQQVFSKQ